MTETLLEENANILKVLDGIELQGSINTSDEDIRANVEHSIRLGYPQVRPQPAQKDRVCLIGGGPSLEDTFDELRDLYFEGAKVVTVNGSYHWCLERNIRPSAQIVLDARQANARFVNPVTPQCKYLLASQCHPETWAQVEGRPDVWIWHAAANDSHAAKPVLDEFYQQQWMQTPGGTTVVMRAISVLRALGFLRFDLFGVDSCVMHGKHHAYEQPENAKDRVFPFDVYPTGHPEMSRRFWCTAWHAKQLECACQMVRINGHQFLLNVHGDGLVAYALKVAADVQMIQRASEPSETISGAQSC